MLFFILLLYRLGSYFVGFEAIHTSGSLIHFPNLLCHRCHVVFILQTEFCISSCMDLTKKMSAEPPLSSTSKTTSPHASLHDGGPNGVGSMLGAPAHDEGAQRSGGLMPDPARSSAANDIASPVLSSSPPQLSNGAGSVSPGAAERARKLQPHPDRSARWADEDAAAAHDAVMEDDMHVVADAVVSSVCRVPTPPHEIRYTRSLAPRAPPPPHEFVPASSPSPVSSECVFDVDLHALGKGYVLYMNAANNYCMLQRLLHKKAEEHKVQYSVKTPMPGLLVHRVDVHIIRSDARPVHRFHLHFDTTTHATDAVAFLVRLGLHTRAPTPAITRGMLHGIPFSMSHEQVQTYLQEHAWFRGGAPSLHVDRVSRAGMAVEDVKDNAAAIRGECHFYVLKSELSHVFSMPAPGNASYPLTWREWVPPRTTVCSHCFQEGHTRAKCSDINKHNANTRVSGACTVCRSFDHAASGCPHAREESRMCVLCKTGRHPIHSCPKYIGSFITIGAGMPPSRPNAWKGRARVAQQQVAPAQQAPLQPRPHQQSLPRTNQQVGLGEGDVMRMLQEQAARHDQLMHMVMRMMDTMNNVVAQLAMMGSTQHVSVGLGRDMSAPAGNKAVPSSSSSRLAPSQPSVVSFFNRAPITSRRASTPLVTSTPPDSSLSSLSSQSQSQSQTHAQEHTREEEKQQDSTEEEDTVFPDSPAPHDSDSDDSSIAISDTMPTKQKANGKRVYATPPTTHTQRPTSSHQPTASRTLHKPKRSKPTSGNTPQ
jgi:hypothetical protein